MPWMKKARWNIINEWKSGDINEKLTLILDRSVTFRHVVVGDRSVTFWHVVVGDRSVTFRHKKNKENESWIMLIYSNLKNLFPKWVWCGGLSPHRCAWCCGQWFLYLLLSPVEYCSWFYIMIRYILLSILSWPMIPTQYVFLVLTPTCNFFSLCYLWSAANVPSTSTLPQL